MTRKMTLTGIAVLMGMAAVVFLVVLQKIGARNQEYTSTPTTWSQAGDYEIKEVPGQQRVVTNKKAGFSFKVPAGWRIKGENGISSDEYFLDLFSPIAKFDENNLLLEGCFVNIETIEQKDEVTSINLDMKSIQANSTVFPNKKVVQINGKEALQISIISKVISQDPRINKKITDVIQVEIPVTNHSVADFKLSTKKKNSVECTDTFSKFLQDISLYKYF